ncbi:MAG: EamA family transporter [Myxococcota bacterium]
MTFADLALVLASALLHAVWSASIKNSRDPLIFNLHQLAPPLVLLVGTLPWIHLAEIPSGVWGWLVATSLAHGGYYYWMSRAYERGDLTLVYPITRSTPAFVPLVAVPLLGESISPLGGAGIAVVVFGMWLVQIGQGLRWSSLSTPAALPAYLTLAATVAYSLCDKGAMSALGASPWTSPVPRSLFYCLAISCSCGFVFAPLVLRQRSVRQIVSIGRDERMRATATSLASLVGYSLILLTLETAPVSYVVAARQTSVLFALMLGIVWLRERPGRLRLIGACVNVAGVALIALSDPG